VVEEVHKQTAKLDARIPSLENCHVVIEASGRPGRTLTSCRVTVRLWGAEPSGMLCSSVSEAHVNDLRPAVHRAFEAVRRQLFPRKSRTRSHAPAAA
jgi:ribosome-associated translation inhibitor RaiA